VTEVEKLRLEIAEIAGKIRLAYDEGNMTSFHLFLGMIVGMGERIYEANAKAERGDAP